MRRATPTMPVTPVMLRHFAVLTLVITSCIGIFASGENRESAEQQLKPRTSNSAASQAKSAPANPPKIIGGLIIGAGTRLGPSPDAGGYFDSEGGGGSGSGETSPYQGSETGNVTPMGPPPGLQSPHLATASQGPPPGVGRNQRKGRPNPPPLRQPTAQELDRMMAASRERSGGVKAE